MDRNKYDNDLKLFFWKKVGFALQWAFLYHNEIILRKSYKTIQDNDDDIYDSYMFFNTTYFNIKTNKKESITHPWISILKGAILDEFNPLYHITKRRRKVLWKVLYNFSNGKMTSYKIIRFLTLVFKILDVKIDSYSCIIEENKKKKVFDLGKKHLDILSKNNITPKIYHLNKNLFINFWKRDRLITLILNEEKDNTVEISYKTFDKKTKINIKNNSSLKILENMNKYIEEKSIF